MAKKKAKKQVIEYDGVIDVPDFVFTTEKGKVYYPKATAKATVKVPLEEVEQRGLTSSKEYDRFLVKLAEEQIKKQAKENKNPKKK